MSAFKTLRKNFIELAVHENRDQLIAFRGRLFFKGSFLGKVVIWLCSKFFKCGSVDEVINSSKARFTDMMDSLKDFQKIYFTEESARLRKKPFDFKKIEEAEREILRSCLFFRPLFKEGEKGNSSFLNDLLSKDKDWKEVLRAVKFIDKKRSYEWLTEGPLPMELFVKAAFSAPLKVREEAKLEEWVKKLEGAKKKKAQGFQGKYAHHYVTVRKQHRFLYELYHRLIKDEKAAFPGANPSLAAFEKKLYTLGLKNFDDCDEEHMKWVKSLAKGQTVKYEENELTLSDELTSDFDKAQNRRVFAIEGNHELELVFYRNEASSYIEEHHDHLIHFGIPLARVLSRKEKGAIAFREKVIDPLDQIRWTSKEALSEEDLRTLEPIVKLLYSFTCLPYTPHPLEPSDFGYNSLGEMRALRPMQEGSYCFEALEHFAYAISQGNLAVFAHLMQEGKLLETEEAKQYQAFAKRVMDAIVDNEPTEIPEKHPDIMERYRMLAETLNDAFLKLHERDQAASDPLSIAEEILHKYMQGPFCSFLPKEFLA